MWKSKTKQDIELLKKVVQHQQKEIDGLYRTVDRAVDRIIELIEHSNQLVVNQTEIAKAVGWRPQKGEQE
jgi:hypothetical protein